MKKGHTPKDAAVAGFNTDTHLTPRQQRAALALLARPHSTAELRGACLANNSWEVVRQLRAKGLNILTRRKDYTTVDNQDSWYGIYELTKAARVELSAWASARKNQPQPEAHTPTRQTAV